MDYLSKFKKLDIKTKKMISGSLSGNFKSAFKGRGLEFDEFREYDLGEDSKYIDWLVSAREQKLLTKKYVVDKNIKVFFILDTTKSMEFGFEKTKIDTLLEIFFLIALSSIENSDDVGALIFDENKTKFYEPKKGKAHLFDIYKTIFEKEKMGNKIKYEENKSLGESFAFLNKIRLKNTFLFILTDKMNIKDDKNLKLLSIKNDVVFVNIFDNFENTLEEKKENLGVIGFLGSFGNGLFIDTNNRRKKEEYRLFRQKKINDLSLFLKKNGINYLNIDNKTNIYKEFFKLFTD